MAITTDFPTAFTNHLCNPPDLTTELNPVRIYVQTSPPSTLIYLLCFLDSVPNDLRFNPLLYQRMPAFADVQKRGVS